MSARLRPNTAQMDKLTRKHYERSCEQKNGYPTAACALIHCLDRKRESGDDLWAYGPCRYCGMYHAGHSPIKMGRENVMRCIESLLMLDGGAQLGNPDGSSYGE